MVQEEGVNDEMMFMVLKGVLRGIHALHDARLVHGAIHPNNIFISDSGLAILAEYDFTKALVSTPELLGFCQ